VLSRSIAFLFAGAFLSGVFQGLPVASSTAWAESAGTAPPSPAPSGAASSSVNPAPIRSFQLEGNELVVPAPVVFETGTDRIKPESEAALEHVRAYLEAKSYITLLRIEQHTDSDGDAAKGLELSGKRADAVARWLVSHGVDCKRLLPVGFGNYKPVAANDSPENKAQNRRTVFVNAALRDRPIGGMPVDGGAPMPPGNACP